MNGLLAGLTAGSLFTGIGGLDLAVGYHGAQICWQADPYRQAVLARHWPRVPRYSDIKERMEASA